MALSTTSFSARRHEHTPSPRQLPSFVLGYLLQFLQPTCFKLVDMLLPPHDKPSLNLQDFRKMPG